MRLHVTVDYNDTLRTLTGMERRSKSFVPVFTKARERLKTANAENFASGGLLVGGWRPRERPAAWPILIKSSKLMGSLTSLSGPPNRIGPTTATFGTDVEYARYHQTGTFKMAARKIVFEPRGFAHETGQDAVQHVMGMGRYFVT